MTVFREYVEYYGLPRSLSVDRAAIYETTRDSTVDETLRDAPPLTQFGRAMSELDVKLILAKSPQAKGRVERRHAVFQDRCVKAMRLKSINTLDAANVFLESEYLDELNSRFSVAARSPTDLHRSVPAGLCLDRVLCYQETRVVQNDWTVSWCNRTFQLSVEHQKLALARKTIMVPEFLDGRIELSYGTRRLSAIELATRHRSPKLVRRSRRDVRFLTSPPRTIHGVDGDESTRSWDPSESDSQRSSLSLGSQLSGANVTFLSGPTL